jgi:hypothetical protein
MALSLDAVYRPFKDFFLQKFTGGAGAPVTFRFAHLPRAFVDSDFLTPLHPEWGPSSAIAQELLSAVVDGVTRLDADGRTVWLSTSRLSELYHDEILGPAIPFVPDDVVDDTERQDRIDAFNNAKADAIGLWAQIKALSLLEGAGVEFRPSTAMPGKWWDRGDAGVWSRQSFQVKGAATLPGQPAHPPDRLLRMKVDDKVMRSVLESHVEARAALQPSPVLAHPVAVLSPPTLHRAQPVFAAALAHDAARADVLRAAPAIGRPAFERQAIHDRPPPAVAIHDEVAPQIEAFPFRQRIEIESMLAVNARTRPVVTSDVTISFDYCVVDVTRPWFHNAFINNRSWRIPGEGKGHLSANDGHGLPALPVGFVAVKRLSIQAPWTPEDITNLQQSVQFGPFNFDSKVVNGAIGHDGIQIIGWMLQDLPDLPPNAAP